MFVKNCFFYHFLVIIIIKLIKCQDGAKDLKRDLFKIYDSQSRPIKNSSAAVDICVGLFVLQIVGLSEKSQVMFISTIIIFKVVGIPKFYEK